MAVALVVSGLWLAGAATLLLVLGVDGAQWLAIAVAVALPVVVIWFAALVARQSAEFRDSAAQAEEALRVATTVTPRITRRPPASPAPSPPPATPISMPLARTAPSSPPAAQVSPDASLPRQQPLPLGMAPAAPAVPLSVLTRALDFPDSPGDEVGFRAMREALDDPQARRLVQSSQDILTLLSREGIYMDDLPPARARPELWRRFAKGERGPEVGPIGGIRDRSSLALTAAKLRSDPVFRDAAHHFLRLFDGTLAEVAAGASDSELAALADTRTARAFMVVGRATGTFE